ncbi:hypothetical protein V5799_023547 [Amblyomma americanum]|uniref:ZZ-type domain-containing protein n=1 Tax=Amblyomma americanum TaxID=6943 RepID=A0AAQ4FJ76_AMBAM
MSSDAELAQAVQNMKDGLLRIFVDVISDRGPAPAASAINSEQKPETGASSSAAEESTKVHVGVLCDACDQEIRGVRYKCLQCEDYDLCGSCHGKKIHEEHDMLKLVNPGIPRELLAAAIVESLRPLKLLVRHRKHVGHGCQPGVGPRRTRGLQAGKNCRHWWRNCYCPSQWWHSAYYGTI